MQRFLGDTEGDEGAAFQNSVYSMLGWVVLYSYLGTMRRDVKAGRYLLRAFEISKGAYDEHALQRLL